MDHQTNETHNSIQQHTQVDRSELQLPQIKIEEDESSSIHPLKDDQRILPRTAPPLGVFDLAHKEADLSSNSLDSTLSPQFRRRNGVRADRIESSWEDISSDEDSDTNTINLKMAQIRADRSTNSTPTRRSLSLLLDHEDQWEDEDAIVDGSDSEDSQTTAETAHSHGRHGNSKLRTNKSAANINGQNSSASEDDGIRSTPQGRSSRLPRRNSAQRALREYRKSKLALLQSESDNVERYNRIMRGEQVDVEREDEKSSRELRRADTIDLLDKMDPFSASIGTEAVDDADTSARAHDIRFRSDHRQRGSVDSPARPPSHSRRSSQNVPLRSPRLPLRKLSTSPNIKTVPLPLDSNDDAHASFSEEQYASVPASPADHTPNGNEWIHANDRGKESITSAKTSPALKVEPPSSDEVQHSRRSSRNADSAPSNHASGGKGGENHPRSDLISAQLDQLAEATPPFSLWDYLKEEIMASDFDSTQEMKWERVTNFIAIPFWMEKIMFFGFFVCLDSFLYTFTILPIRFLVAIYCVVSNFVVWIAGGPRRYLSSSHKCDILKTLLIIMSCWILSRITDASKMYHSVRGQDVVKLYVIFNVLEIADRLCCSFGQDLLDSLFSRSTLARRKDGHQPYLRPLGFFALSLLYVLAHTLVLLYQLVTLNVAINSYDNALLTLLLSNQFVEIKGSVFKKFEKENLFQLTCADIVERFQLTLMLCSIGLRNLIEVAGAAGNSIAALTPPAAVPEIVEEVISPNANASKFSSPLSAIAILGALPTSFTVFPSFSLLETIFTPVCIVLASEFVVDWLKHAFITKFNHIRPSVYGRFMDVLCRDLVMAGPVVRSSSSRRKHTFVDQSPVVSRRLGFAAVPLACLLVRMTSQVMGMLHDDSHFDECAVPDWHKHAAEAAAMANDNSWLAFVWHTLRRPVELILSPMVNNPKITLDLALYYLWSTAAWILTITIAWFFLVALKLILGTNLVSFASSRYATMGQREKEEELNARDRQPIGVDKDEMAYDAKVSQLIDKKDDDASRMGLGGQPIPTPAKYQGGKNNKGSESLMDVSRYTMVRSRIW